MHLRAEPNVALLLRGAGTTGMAVGVVLLALLGGAARSAEPTTGVGASVSVEAEWEALTGQLGDTDPAVRQRAFERLASLGAAARPALLRAALSNDPEIRAEASQLLLRLPWERAGDPPLVRQVLLMYAKMDAAHRQEAAGRLAGLPSGMGHPALLRLLQEEPSDQVKWFVVSLLRGRHLPGDLAALRDMPVTSASRSAPLLAAVGWAWQGKDPAKAQAILREAVAVEAVHPSLDAGAMDFAFNVLVREAVASQRYNEAAALLRRRCIRAGSVTSEQRLVDGVAELFALHARFGPLQGWEEDQRVFAAYLTRPQVIYALARLCDQKGDTLLGNALRQAAWAVSLDSCEEHWIAAEFLATRHWDSWARRELETLLTLSEEAAARGGATPASEVYTANAHFRLAGLTMRRGDDFGTAEHLRLAMEAMERIGRGAGLVAGAQQEEARPITGPAIWAEIRWRYFRAARAKGDAAEMRKQLDELLKLPCDNADMVPDVVPALKQMGRAEDASRLFATAYASMKARMDAEPGEAEHMNNLAWLCARSDERLEEALKLATAAVQAAPDNSAYLDTAAEVHFRLGHAEEAVRLEKRAIELRPNDGFMREQLKRFEGKGESQGTKAPRH